MTGTAYDGANGSLGRATRLSLPRWNTVVAFDGPLGRRMRRRYVRESVQLLTARTISTMGPPPTRRWCAYCRSETCRLGRG